MLQAASSGLRPRPVAMCNSQFVETAFFLCTQLSDSSHGTLRTRLRKVLAARYRSGYCRPNSGVHLATLITPQSWRWSDFALSTMSGSCTHDYRTSPEVLHYQIALHLHTLVMSTCDLRRHHCRPLCISSQNNATQVQRVHVMRPSMDLDLVDASSTLNMTHTSSGSHSQ